MKEWFKCSSCEEEFRAIVSAMVEVNYCPVCGSEIDDLEDEDEDDLNDE